MKARKRAAIRAQQMKVKTPKPSQEPATTLPAKVPGNQQAPVSQGRLDTALAYYGAMAAHGKG